MKIYNEIVFDIDGNVTYEDTYEYSGDVILMQGDTDCVAQGKVQCTDGTCADNLEDCGRIYTDYSQDIGYTPSGEFIDDTTTTGTDEGLKDIYEAVGGADWTGKTFAEWSADYAETFPTWADSTYERQSELIEAQLGLLPEAMRVKEESFLLKGEQLQYKAESDLASTRQSREALIRAGGGLTKGETEEKFETAYDQVLKGFDSDTEALALEEEASLMDFESRLLSYEFDLEDVIEKYKNQMWGLIEGQRDAMKDLGSDVDVRDQEVRDTVMDCITACGENNPGCVSDCRTGVDDVDYGEEDDPLTYGPDDYVISNQGCIDECIDGGGNAVDCRVNCTKGTTTSGGTGGGSAPCIDECMSLGTSRALCTEECS